MGATKPRLDVVVKDQYTEGSLSRYVTDDKTLFLDFKGTSRNVNIDLSIIEKRIGHRLSPAVMDLYLIAMAVYLSDLSILRNLRVGYRTIRILISVSDKVRWDQVKTHIESTLQMLTNGDIFIFDFVQGQLPSRAFGFSIHDKRVASLFSGGLDSLSGVRWLLDQSLEPILVSHRSQYQIGKVQLKLVEALRKVSGQRLDFYRISTQKNFQQREYSQFARSFLYLTLAAVFALELGLERIFVFENGVISINLPISPGRIFGNTRTTYPPFLVAYQELLNRAFAAKIEIVTPFLHKTKGEVVKNLDLRGYKELAKVSISCTERGAMRYAKIAMSEITHCGKCLPCILRRVSMDYAGLWDYDASYANDICGKYDDISIDAVKLIAQILDSARRLDLCPTGLEALYEFPTFRMHESIDPSPLIEMYRRHFSQFREFLDRRASNTLKEKLML